MTFIEMIFLKRVVCCCLFIVNHFQVIDFDATDETGAFEHANLVRGTYRDTVPASDVNTITLRFAPHRFVGPQVAHCHVGSHADLGMMTEVL